VTWVEPRLVVLKLILDALGVSAKPESLQARKAIQKAVYLAQSAGAPLGYSYGWYVKGPYSPSLAQDYYALSRQEGGVHGFQLNDAVRTSLSKLGRPAQLPAGVKLSEADWLELLASVHFLYAVRNRDKSGVRAVLTRQKPQLVVYMDAAETRLREMSLL
jgi:uncharacterized protein YwgA